MAKSSLTKATATFHNIESQPYAEVEILKQLIHEKLYLEQKVEYNCRKAPHSFLRRHAPTYLHIPKPRLKWKVIKHAQLLNQLRTNHANHRINKRKWDVHKF